MNANKFKLNFPFSRAYQKKIKLAKEKSSFISGTIYKNMIASFTKYNYPNCELLLKIRFTDEKLKSTHEQAKNAKVSFKIFDNKRNYVEFVFNFENQTLTFDKNHSINPSEEIEKQSFKILPNSDGLITLKFLCEPFSCKTFVNENQPIFSNTYVLNKNIRKLSINSTMLYGIYFKLTNIK